MNDESGSIFKKQPLLFSSLGFEERPQKKTH
jgi:hypothetical protein